MKNFGQNLNEKMNRSTVTIKKNECNMLHPEADLNTFFINNLYDINLFYFSSITM